MLKFSIVYYIILFVGFISPKPTVWQTIARGIYYLETNAVKPYAKGLPVSSSRKHRKRN